MNRSDNEPTIKKIVFILSQSKLVVYSLFLFYGPVSSFVTSL